MITENVMNKQIPQGLTAVFKALSDPNRLNVFAALMRGVSCNAWLTAELDLAPNLLSHHLKVLRDAGLVQDRRDRVDGRWVYYQVNVETLAELHSWLGDFFNPLRVNLNPTFCGPETAQSPAMQIGDPVVREAKEISSC
jgi:ArsR family transcriptional regulator, arsenate/arsenite/antimonite-responsive transcriptional repressor